MHFREIAGARNVVVFQYKGWLRTWQVKLCGTTVAERPRVFEHTRSGVCEACWDVLVRDDLAAAAKLAQRTRLRN